MAEANNLLKISVNGSQLSQEEIVRQVAVAERKAKELDEWLDRQADEEANKPWEPLVPLDEFKVPAFPSQCLPSWLRDYVEALALAAQVPVDLPAMLALSVLAIACAKKVEVQIKEGYAEPVNAYTLIAMGPANRKSTVFAEMVAPLQEWEQGEIRRLEPIIARFTSQRKIAEERLERIQKRAANAQDEGLSGLTAEADVLARELTELPVPPMRPCVLADDTTSERVPSLLRENQGRLGIMSAEGGIFENMAGRYGTKGMPNFDIYLKAHSGDAVRVDRVGRASEYVRRPALTMGLTVQPNVVAGLAKKPGFRGRGLLARFWYCVPESLVGRRDCDAPPVPARCRLAYRDKILALMNVLMPSDPNPLTFSPEAREARLNFDREIESQLGPGGELAALADWGGKLVGAVARIAGLLHMAEHAGEGSIVPPLSPFPWAIPITGDTMKKAIMIGRYLIEHANAAFGVMAADPDIEDAKTILAWLRRKRVQRFTRRELFEGTKRQFKEANALIPPMNLLEERAYIRFLGGRDTGGRQIMIYEANPAILSPQESPQQS